MGLHKKIAMRCTKEQFEAIKPKLKNAGYRIDIDDFKIHDYLCIHLDDGKLITIYSKYCLNVKKRIIYEEWNEKVFLEACGISEIPTLEEVKEYFKNAKKIKSVISGSIYKINTEKLGVYFDGHNYRQNTNSDDSRLLLWEENNGYTKIIACKYKITKETILKYNMKDEFPELFEKKLEVGQP